MNTAAQSATKHTAEPWELYEHGRRISIHPANGDGDVTICTTPEHMQKARMVRDRLMDSTDEDKANAARIVAVINAMAGIEDPTDFVRRALAAGVHK